MSAPVPFRETLGWLARHAGFPERRLEPQAETVLCIAALAALEEDAERQRFVLNRRNPAESAALRAHALRRSRVHFKSDNSAKV